MPDRPLIGIAALGNPVLGLAKRDDHFGWSANGLERPPLVGGQVLVQLGPERIDLFEFGGRRFIRGVTRRVITAGG